MNSKVILSAAVALSLLTGSCSKDNGTVNPDMNGTNTGTGTGNEQTGMSYQLRAVNTTGSMNQRTTANGTIQWTSGYAYPTQIKFEAKQQNSKIEYKSTNNSRIDLFSPVATSFGSFMLPAGTYKEIELKVKLDNVGNEPALFLTGNYMNNGVVIPVIFRVDDKLELKTELNDVTIDNTSSIAAITNLDLATYTNGITDEMIRNAQLTNGTLIISENSNRNLYNIIMSNLSGKRHKCSFKKNK
jgi:hypothetical protein